MATGYSVAMSFSSSFFPGLPVQSLSFRHCDQRVPSVVVLVLIVDTFLFVPSSFHCRPLPLILSFIFGCTMSDASQ